jgi:hypothetical protein
MSNAKSKKPTHNVVIAEEGSNDKKFYTTVGAAWKHENGEGFNILIKSGLSVSGKIMVFPVRENEAEAEG